MYASNDTGYDRNSWSNNERRSVRSVLLPFSPLYRDFVFFPARTTRLTLVELDGRIYNRRREIGIQIRGEIVKINYSSLY
jgi:hypothetical protein